jgi:hypothetical protein
MVCPRSHPDSYLETLRQITKTGPQVSTPIRTKHLQVDLARGPVVMQWRLVRSNSKYDQLQCMHSRGFCQQINFLAYKHV